ncbi:uncharacterized protein LOC111258912 isoform X1 [Varroa jacobsoni]|uniref:uncharacterized protein LOC111258912 isoform X1 n=1 Tax=Varroa jacobsoni TaxID=62625 RepID=UPI000BF26465|nr:uncharacterized protein LOC111258912 isoform X1 [Varroa jacobsoni]
MSSAKVMSANVSTLALHRFNPRDAGFTGSWRELPLAAQDILQARVFDGPGGYVKHDLIFPRPPLQAVEDNLNKWHKNMVQDLQKNCGRRGTITSAPIGMKSPFWSSDKKKSWKSPNGYVNLEDSPNPVNQSMLSAPQPPPRQELPVVSTITNNYATLAAAERSQLSTQAGISVAATVADIQRKTVEQTRQKPSRCHDRKVSMRGAAPDTMSLPSLRKPLVAHRATGAMASSSGLGPLSQWQLTGENYIDSEQRKRHRAALAPRRNEDHFVSSSSKENRRVMYSCGPLGGTWETTHSGHTSPDSPGSVASSSPNSLASSSMADVEKPLRKPREERSTVFDRTVRIPRKKLVLDGPLHATSYAHWNSQVFPPPPGNATNGSSD